MFRGLLVWGAGVTLALAASAQEVGDPHLWLEEITGVKALNWVKERNAESTAELAGSEQFIALQGRVLKILDSDEKIPLIDKAGTHYYNFWRDGNNNRGLWRRTTLDEYRKDKPNWEIVLDLDALAKAENENWAWSGEFIRSFFLRPSYSRCLVRLSRGGADAVVVREFDLEKKVFVNEASRCQRQRAKWLGVG